MNLLFGLLAAVNALNGVTFLPRIPSSLQIKNEFGIQLYCKLAKGSNDYSFLIEMYSTGYNVDGDSNSAVVNLYLKEQNNPAGFSYMVAVTGGTLISIDPSYSNVRFVTNANNYTSVGPCTDRF